MDAFAAAKLLGIETVPAVRLSHLSEVERRAYVVADNKLCSLHLMSFAMPYPIVEFVSVTSLHPYDRNARTHSKKQTRQIANSTARTPVAKIAAALGVSEDEFSAWSRRVVATRTLSFTELDALFPMPDIGRARREHTIMRGERLFESEPEEDAEATQP